MAGDSSGKKWWKRLGVGGREPAAKSKTKDGSLQEINAVLGPEHASSTSTTAPPALQPTAGSSTLFPPAAPPAPSGTALQNSLKNNGDKPLEIPQMTTSDKIANTREEFADGSLWDRAYDALRNEEPECIAAYEVLLSKAHAGAQTKTPTVPIEKEDIDKDTNRIPQDAVTRREKLKKITELGLEHMRQKKISTTLLGHEIVLRDVVAEVARVVEWAEDYIKDAVKDLPYASIVMAGVSLVLPLLKNPPKDEAANQDGFTYVTSQMRYYVAMESLLLPEDMKADLKADLSDRLVGLYKLIIDFQVQSVIRFYRSRTKNFFRGIIAYDGWEKKLQDIKDGDKELVSKLETAMSRTSLQALKQVAREAEYSRQTLDNLLGRVEELVGVSQNHLDIAQNAETRACLEALQASDPRDDKDRIELEKGGLLRDTYRWILSNHEFRQWHDDPDSQLLWIRGDPGKGKTMLLCGIIDEMKSTAPTANISFFFCQATDARINNATAVLRGLVYMLVTQQPAFISHVRESYDGFGEQRFKDSNSWVALSKIFTSILGDSRLRRAYLIVDALDECTQDLSLLLDLITQKSSLYPNVKWIVSSRNWPSIEKDLDTATQKVRLSLELNEASVSAAVTTYVRFKVEALAKRNKYGDDTRNAIERYLSANAHGTFLWVALVCKELAKISEWKVQERLVAFPSGLNALYRQMMNQICTSEDATLCKGILAVISVVYRPITVDELTALVDMPAGVSGNHGALAEIVGLCGSFLTLRERTISFVHQSAKDFLLKQARNEIFSSEIEYTHHTVFSQSLQAMSKTLRRDIYSLGAPGISIDRVRRPDPDPLAAVRYSCVYWISHLRDCDPKKNAIKNLQDGGSIDTFLSEKYLYWLEALSLQKSMSEGAGKETSLPIDRVRDACRFILYYKWAIENGPLQVYASALVFSPARSITRNQFENEEPRWIIRKPTMADNWGVCIQTLEGHSNDVYSVAWSHNSTRLASASADNTVKIWDPATGQCVSTLEGHRNWVRSVAWSHDATRLASASDDYTVKIWDPATGQCVSMIEGHSHIKSVSWSRYATMPGSGLEDRIVKIWDPATGQCVLTLEGHSYPINSAWSHDATRLASASNDRTVKIWDPATGQCVLTLEGHHENVNSVAWSHDATRLASASNDGTVKIWDPATGQCVSTLEGHSNDVYSVAWSHNSTRLASASEDNTVKIWNPATDQCVSTLKDHTSYVWSVAWSHDSTRLASASKDNTVKIWDPATGPCESTLNVHSSYVWSMAWSHDATRLASASRDNTVKIWDPATGQCVATLEGHSDGVGSVVWSHDATRIASASHDYTIKIWDPATGQCVSTLVGHRDWVTSVAWSRIATRLASASASSDMTVKIWDPATGQCVLTLEGHHHNVNSVAWSHDATRLASASDDGTVKIWDPATGQCVSTLIGFDSRTVDSVACFTSVAWSHDATRLASGSDDETVKIWDPTTGDCVSTLEIGRVLYDLQFHEVNSDLLHTELGTFDLQTVAISSDFGSASSYNLSRIAIGYGLSSNGTWITYEGENLLWLPPEYRPSSSAISGPTVSIGCSSGRVLIFTFTDSSPIQ
ncbi:WD40-repeat-containing domain protein [Achaetomium macrosporum]|uniref:Mitochondrial division protein 1 n=1 Tax=Achaetomium macrosporum TaxID=79813 RepID=A0AAN7C325_9PEZI|nr:WD40-repeat-containing domain protein [Achaetomium macrosporum]